jgi:hypothetical protein
LSFAVLGNSATTFTDEMRFLVPVVPGNTMEIEVKVLKFLEDFALVEAVATVDATMVAKGKLGFARRGLQTHPRPSELFHGPWAGTLPQETGVQSQNSFVADHCVG